MGAVLPLYGRDSNTERETCPILPRSGGPITWEQWYTKRDAVLFVLLLFVVVQSVSTLIPPFQSPDEVNHLQRAYTLSQGDWLPTWRGNSAGGAVDTGLLKYTDYYSAIPFDYSAKVTRTLLANSDNIGWTSERVFSDFSNTALYFPIPYIPQALAFKDRKSVV